jgi:hypothetical protein
MTSFFLGFVSASALDWFLALGRRPSWTLRCLWWRYGILLYFVSSSLSLSDNVSLAFLTIVPIAFEHYLCASVVDIGVVGLRIWFILMLM